MIKKKNIIGKWYSSAIGMTGKIVLTRKIDESITLGKIIGITNIKQRVI